MGASYISNWTKESFIGFGMHFSDRNTLFRAFRQVGISDFCGSLEFTLPTCICKMFSVNAYVNFKKVLDAFNVTVHGNTTYPRYRLCGGVVCFMYVYVRMGYIRLTALIDLVHLMFCPPRCDDDDDDAPSFPSARVAYHFSPVPSCLILDNPGLPNTSSPSTTSSPDKSNHLEHL